MLTLLSPRGGAKGGVALRFCGQMKRNQMLIAQMLQFMAKALAKLPLGVRHNGDNSHIVLTPNQCARAREHQRVGVRGGQTHKHTDIRTRPPPLDCIMRSRQNRKTTLNSFAVHFGVCCNFPSPFFSLPAFCRFALNWQISGKLCMHTKPSSVLVARTHAHTQWKLKFICQFRYTNTIIRRRQNRYALRGFAYSTSKL